MIMAWFFSHITLNKVLLLHFIVSRLLFYWFRGRAHRLCELHKKPHLTNYCCIMSDHSTSSKMYRVTDLF